MKNYIILLSVMLAATFAFGQAKDNPETQNLKTDSVTKEEKTVGTNTDSLSNESPKSSIGIDSMTAKSQTAPVKPDTLSKASKTHPSKVDSLTRANHNLSMKLDSVTRVLAKYQTLYIVIKEKIFKHDFDPARMSQILDSMAARGDSSLSGINSTTLYLQDSIAVLNLEIMQLKTKYSEITPEDIYKGRLARELKHLKELLDMKVLTQSEFHIKKTMILEKWE